MTQRVAAKFASYKSAVHEFLNWINSVCETQQDLTELNQTQLEDKVLILMAAIREAMKEYDLPDYRVRFLEYTLQNITREVNATKLPAATKKKVNNKLRVGLKDSFELEFASYPFVFSHTKLVQWKWTYRQILAVLYIFKQLDAFDGDADVQMSNLKDLIYYNGYANWDEDDVSEAYKDVKQSWKKISESGLDANFSAKQWTIANKLEQVSSELDELLKP